MEIQNMRDLNAIRLVNAQAVLREAEDRRGSLTLVEAQEVARAIRDIQELTEGRDEKTRRRELWERKKGSKARFWRGRE